MKKSVLNSLIALITVLCATTAPAAPDQYPGDTSIYGSDVTLEPNVLLILDNSGSMADTATGAAVNYSPSTTYTPSNVCLTNGVDTCNSTGVYQFIPTGSTAYTYLTDISNVSTNCNGKNPQSLLKGSSGQYTGRLLNANGTCGTTGTGSYYYGNYINWLNSPGQAVPKETIVLSVVDKLIKSTTSVRFGVMTYNYAQGSNGLGGTFIAAVPAGATATYTSTIQEMDNNFQTTPKVMTNRTALRRILSGISPNGNTPLSETLYEARQYFQGAAPAFGATIGVSSGTYTSPVQLSCQHNYVVFLTDGMSTSDNYTSTNFTPWADSGVNFLNNTLGQMCQTGSYYTADCDADGSSPGMNDTTAASLPCFDSNGNKVSCCENYNYNPVDCGVSTGTGSNKKKYLYYDYSQSLADVAKYLNQGPNNISSYFIGFGADASSTAAVNLLSKAADTHHGQGAFYTASTQTDLSTTFSTIIANILAVNTSFVAPVVPVSPENRTYGSNRVYMGFFKPENTSASWLGNMKKYGIDTNNNIADENGNYATYVDLNGDGVDDRSPFPALPSGYVNGAFRPSAESYWSTAVDGGTVNAGGVGALLQAMSSITTTRNIYTVANTTPAPGAALVPLSSTSITQALLNVPDATTRTNVLNFIYGLDVYGSNPTANKAWVMGDVMHSRPLILNYASYDTTVAANETNCLVNKSMIYVGGNDGMLHAFRDCDGGEAWAFVPPDMLPNLQFLTGTQHSYYADSTPVSYVYNNGNTGTINSVNGDKVIMMFGERRGGGTNVAAAGSYYALDVTNPASPTFLWSISKSTAGFSQLGETWSEPKIVKMSIGSPAVDNIVAFFGAGYDNLNEDSRYGNTQSFSGLTTVNNGDIGQTPAVSASGSAASPQLGMGIFAVQLATLNASSGKPTITATPTKIWSYTYGTGSPTSPNKYDTNMQFSFPGQMTAIDTFGSGYTDTLYAGDTGGNLWRFDVGNKTVVNWAGNKIFSSNPGNQGASDTGRKIFYTPSVVTQIGYRMIFFGTGDREHPLNTAVTDRIYAIKDPIAPAQPITTATALTENSAGMLDVTTDELQNNLTSAAQIASDLNTLYSASAGGWFIRLPNSGEKVLAAPTVFNKVAYFTTFAPGITNTNPCATGNLGTSRQYALNYQTGEAAMDYNTYNDSPTTPPSNTRMNAPGGGVLDVNDRSQVTGSGIPSGMVVLMTPGGQTIGFTGIGGAIASSKLTKGGTIYPLYWRQK